jgi:predicted dehydrogenase
LQTRVGVIGAGKWGQNLVRTFAQLGVLGGVAERDPLIRRELSKRFPEVPLYAEADCLLKKEADISALVIATPADTHYMLSKAALLADKDVLVEKPLALLHKEASELVKIAEKKARILMVGHLLLYQDAVPKIKNCLTSGIIGQPLIFYQERLKLGKVRSVENVLWSFGVHDLAVLFYLIGEATQKAPVISVTRHCALQNKIEDDVFLHLQFSEGIRAHLHVSWLWPVQRRSLTIVGSEAMLIYDEIQQKVILHKKKVRGDYLIQDEGSEIICQGKPEPLVNECRSFLECVCQRTRPLSDGCSALPVIAVLEKATQKLREM